MVGIDAALRHRMMKQGFELEQKGHAIRPLISPLHSTGAPSPKLYLPLFSSHTAD
jgi:hypothetical protein